MRRLRESNGNHKNQTEDVSISLTKPQQTALNDALENSLNIVIIGVDEDEMGEMIDYIKDLLSVGDGGDDGEGAEDDDDYGSGYIGINWVTKERIEEFVWENIDVVFVDNEINSYDTHEALEMCKELGIQIIAKIEHIHLKELDRKQRGYNQLRGRPDNSPTLFDFAILMTSDDDSGARVESMSYLDEGKEARVKNQALGTRY